MAKALSVTPPNPATTNKKTNPSSPFHGTFPPFFSIKAGSKGNDSVK
jgi:hypothetical protein